ncbi:SET domain-containing protein [Dichomitus squalens LYAD-421 SS1]|uniref:SET domain-containing protein n=1 Tax=Dichomitus squalens (strain LYAD-421) TaxID=732165 RepID=R7SQE7_DICSQ|nr:SET domain-containing protein [Dichomitus squalens LYAD-421 SS1]EJF57990.1 SET domain-containing protein [Dichomitus squalens LYAD-421 SS1]
MAAAEWIRGSEVERELHNDEGGSLQGEIDDFYVSDVYPLLSSMDMQPTHAGFLRAYSLVCSRAFQIDAYHGLSMVPLADAFNHSHENHVQLASEYDVCPACGSLSECPHDREDGSSIQADQPIAVTPSIDPTDTVDMVTVRSIPPGVEVFNTYGETLGNAALLARYGFMLNGSEADTVTFGWHGSSLELRPGDSYWKSVYDLVVEPAGGILASSLMVYFPDMEPDISPVLSIDSDGRVSIALFVWAIVESMSVQYGAESTELSVSVLRCLLRVEALRDMEERDEDIEIPSEAGPPPGPTAALFLAQTAKELDNLCRTRVANMGRVEYRGTNMEVLGEVFDDLPADRPKTRLALEYLLGERAVLEVCAAGWEEVKNIADTLSLG